MSNFSAISWREQVTFWWDDDDVFIVLDQHAELDFYSASSLNNSPLLQSDTFFLILTSRLLLLSAVCLSDKYQFFIVFGLTRPGLELLIYHTWGKPANHYTTDAIVSCNWPWMNESNTLLILNTMIVKVNNNFSLNENTFKWQYMLNAMKSSSC